MNWPGKNKSLLRKLHAELQRTDAAFDKHVKDYKCLTDSNGCTARRAFQERVATLCAVITLAGGRVSDAVLMDDPTIEELR